MSPYAAASWLLNSSSTGHSALVSLSLSRIGLLGLVPELLPLDSVGDGSLLGRRVDCCLDWFDAITALTAYPWLNQLLV